MKDKKTLSRVLSYLRPQLPVLLLTLLLAAVIVTASLYVPILIGKAIDLCTEGNVDFSALKPLLSQAAVLIALAALLQWLMDILNNKIAFRIVRDVRADAIRKIRRLPFSYLDAHPVGETVNRVITDADTFSDGLLLGFTQFFTAVCTVIGTLIFMIVLDVRIALAVFLLTPLSLLVARFIATHTHDLFLAQSRLQAEQTGFIDETVTGQKAAVAFGHGEENQKRFDDINERLSACSVRALFYSALTNPSTRVVNNLVYLSVALLGGFFCLGANPTMTVGALAVFLRYANQYTKPFNEISGVITELQNALACASRLFELLDAEEITPDAEDAAAPESVNGDVAFKKLCFSYIPGKKLIENVDLSVAAGQRIAIVGPTGCGKTTLINLLMRFYDPTSGKITVDGTATTDYRREALRSQFGMVLQDTWLKAGSVRDNLKMGRPQATDEEMIDAAKKVGAHGFIEKLPNGYDTLLAEDGGSLSAGQKQLLCITRVMLCLPPMLILDEATSSIDTRTELKIQDAFAALMRGRTSFIVAHRLSTVQDADRILVMKNGKILEVGDHETLLCKGGFYAELWNSQFARE